MDAPRMDARPLTQQRQCPFCHDSLHPEDVVWECPNCRTTHHSECANEHGERCAVFACSGAREDDELVDEGTYTPSGRFITTERDDSAIVRSRTPEIVTASFFVRALVGLLMAGHAFGGFAHPEQVDRLGTLLGIFIGTVLALSPLLELSRIRDSGYEAHAGHRVYLGFLGVAMVALTGLCAASFIAPGAVGWLAMTAVLVIALDALWPRA